LEPFLSFVAKAKQKNKKRSWLKRLLIYLATPFVVWFVAFLLWFFWQDMMRLFNRSRPGEKPKAATAPSSDRTRAAPFDRGEEKIREEDRRKLEDIIKRGQ
jgi:flagellar biosynthesis/type III secretory pathway M-ring protein FliF/YscJ